MKPSNNSNKDHNRPKNSRNYPKNEIQNTGENSFDKDDLSYKVKFIPQQPYNNDTKRPLKDSKNSFSEPKKDFKPNNEFRNKKDFSKDGKFQKSKPYNEKPFRSKNLNENKTNDSEIPKKKFKPTYDPEVKNNNKPFKDFKPARKRVSEKIKTPLEPGEIRLNRYVAQSGICSRREADELIKKGLVSVNDNLVTEMGYKVKPNDTVKYQGKIILSEPFVYIVMNKPKDFITTTEDDKGRKTVMDLLVDKVQERVFPIGRLDRNTTGVLLITNDGELAQMLTHPSFEIKKVYHVVLDKKVSQKDLDSLVEGIELEDGVVHADAVAYVESDDKRHVGIELHSGKNRIVRRMFEHLGYDVEKLDRVSFGSFTKKDLPRGKWRHLNNYEIASILKMKEGNK
jgi:23S rRNA pseudouridine2605 synthase